MLVNRNGKLRKAWLIKGEVEEVFYEDTPDPESFTFYRIELYGDLDVRFSEKVIYGMRMAMTNPLYVNY